MDRVYSSGPSASVRDAIRWRACDGGVAAAGGLGGLASAKKKVASANAAAPATNDGRQVSSKRSGQDGDCVPQGTLAVGGIPKAGSRIKYAVLALGAVEGVDKNERRDVNTRAPLTLCTMAVLVLVADATGEQTGTAVDTCFADASQCARAWCCSQACLEVNA